jgi:hypothetical protein
MPKDGKPGGEEGGEAEILRLEDERRKVQKEKTAVQIAELKIKLQIAQLEKEKAELQLQLQDVGS